MNELDPALKRLMKWSRQAKREEISGEMPFGLATKVLSLSREEKTREEGFNSVAAFCGSMAALVIVASGLFLWDQVQQNEAIYPLGSAYKLATASVLE